MYVYICKTYMLNMIYAYVVWAYVYMCINTGKYKL